MRAWMLPLLLTGCGSDPAVGIWLLQLDPLTEGDEDCTEETTHNFSLAYTDDTGEFSEDVTSTQSATYSFVQVVETDDGNALMLLGDEKLVGTYNGSQWTFTNTRTETTAGTDTHTEDGYTFTEDLSSDRTLSVFFTVIGSEVSGRRRLTTTETSSWTESDEWEAGVVEEVGTTGQLPASRYLLTEQEVPDDTGGGSSIVEVPANNRSRSVECDAAECQLDVSEACELKADFTGVRVDWEDDQPQSDDL